MPLEVCPLENDCLVPEKPQPSEALEDRAGLLVGAARLVRVFDAQEELSTVFFDEEPVDQRGARAADVEVTGWGGGEAESVHVWKGTWLKKAEEPATGGLLSREGRDSNPRYEF